MTLYTFGFAAFIFTTLPVENASLLIRKAFLYLRLGHNHCSGPHCIFQRRHSSLDPIHYSHIDYFSRQVLMPMINQATDAGHKQRFKILHGASFVLTLVHIGAAATVVVRLTNG